MPTALERYEAAKSAYEALVKELGSEIMADVFAPFWEANPEVAAIRWSQYTPYFNDGDPCVFGVNEIDAIRFVAGATLPSDAEVYYGEDDDDDYDGVTAGTAWYEAYGIGRTWDNDKREYTYEPIGRSLEDLDRKLQNMADILQETFGDHVRITATRDAFDVQECNHD